MKCDLHFHLENGNYEDSWFNSFLSNGRKKGIDYYGVVEHIYNFKEYKYIFDFLSEHERKGELQSKWLDECNKSYINDYVNFAQKIKSENNKVFMGIELDYVPDHISELEGISKKYNWDFIIGSIHIMDKWVIDNENEQDEWLFRDIEKTYEQYYKMIIDEINTGIFNIIGHIGNLKVYGKKDTKKRTQYFIEIADAMKEKDVCLEINTGLMYRYPVKEICPDFELLKICKDRGVDITISSDAHMPEDVGKYHDFAVEYAARAGFTKQAIFMKKIKYLIDLE